MIIIILRCIFRLCISTDSLTGRDRCDMRANRFLPVRSSVRPGDLLQSAGAARPGDMEPSGVQGPGGIYCCNQSIQFHCYWGEPRWNTCTNGKRNSVEALAPSSAIELGRIPDAYGGGVTRRGHKLPTQHRPSLRDVVLSSPHLAGLNFTGSAKTLKHLWKQVSYM